MKRSLANSFGILLDSGKVFRLPWKQRARARKALDDWRQRRREAIANNDIVRPRRALGLVTYRWPA